MRGIAIDNLSFRFPQVSDKDPVPLGLSVQIRPVALFFFLELCLFEERNIYKLFYLFDVVMSLERKLKMLVAGAALVGLSSILGCTSPVSSGNAKNNKAQAGCISNSECKGDRICIKGECVEKEPGNNYPPPVDEKDVYTSSKDVSSPNDSYSTKDTMLSKDTTSFDFWVYNDFAGNESSNNNYDSWNNYEDFGNNFSDLNGNYDSFSGCNWNEFQCNDGKCIPQNYLCDGGNDCNNGEDEYNCSSNDVYLYDSNFTNDAGSYDSASSYDASSSCLGFECYNGDCIPLSYRCDGANDCSNGEDELGCPPQSGQFGGACGSSQDCNAVGVGTITFCLTDVPISWTNGVCASGPLVGNCSALEQQIGKSLVSCVSNNGPVNSFGFTKFCLPECISDSECRSDYYCDYGSVGALDCGGKVCLPK